MEAGWREQLFIGLVALFQSSPCESTDSENKTKVLYQNKDDEEQ